jgi:hypothetical protein
MGAAVAVVNRVRGAQVAPQDDLVSLTSSQESLMREMNGEAGGYDAGPETDFQFPAMPKIGSNMDIQILIERNEKMHKRFREASTVVSRAVKKATSEAQTVPVADATSRVLVSEEISERMKKVKTRKQIRMMTEANINEIQQALTVRMRTHEIMNNNSSGVLINKIEPVFIKEARGDVIYLDEDEEYED